ncbi:MAG: hypothetical protein KKG59_06375 [Nanoarchaeota archaeon]|nr:hypothetical protein [Nanoarchaeota archaeon]
MSIDYEPGQERGCHCGSPYGFYRTYTCGGTNMKVDARLNPYRKNLSILLRAKYPVSKANKLAKKLTDAQRAEKEEEFRTKVDEQLEKYGLI